MKSLFAFALMLMATSAQADVFLENLTWTELRDQIAQGTTTVIIPVGGTEQSGPHLALGKHNARVKFLAEKIATKLGQTLVAPVIAYALN
jgi:creatinine amidohydrolase